MIYKKCLLWMPTFFGAQVRGLLVYRFGSSRGESTVVRRSEPTRSDHRGKGGGDRAGCRAEVPLGRKRLDSENVFLDNYHQVESMKAWLVTWEWCGDHAQVEDNIAAVLNSRLSGKRVREIVELLFVNSQYSPSERLRYANSKKSNPYPARFGMLGRVPWEGEIFCGHFVDIIHIFMPAGLMIAEYWVRV